MEDKPAAWTLIRLSDGEDEFGNYDCWHDYQDTDGRVATQFSDGSCSDAGLAEFLAMTSASVKAKTPLGRLKSQAQSGATLLLTKLLRSLLRAEERTGE